MQYGKYKVYENNQFLEIHYRYSFSDITGSLIYALSVIIGAFLLYLSCKTFVATSMASWAIITLGLILLTFGVFAFSAALHRPKHGLIQIDKTKKELIIHDFLKAKRIKKQ